MTLAWVGARHPGVRLGTSVIVVPMRNAVTLAKDLATLDSLSGGRVIAGVGIGWNETEFANVGAADRFHVRGAYLDETITLWRHLWSGSSEPFHGRFHTIDDFVFGPLPVQAPLPIVIGGRAEPALERAGRTADGYQSSSTRRPPTPSAWRSSRRRPRPPDGPPRHWRLALRSASATTPKGRMRCTARPRRSPPRSVPTRRIGVEHIALAFGVTDPAAVVDRAERFAREVAPLV